MNALVVSVDDESSLSQNLEVAVRPTIGYIGVSMVSGHFSLHFVGKKKEMTSCDENRTPNTNVAEHCLQAKYRVTATTEDNL